MLMLLGLKNLLKNVFILGHFCSFWFILVILVHSGDILDHFSSFWVILVHFSTTEPKHVRKFFNIQHNERCMNGASGINERNKTGVTSFFIRTKFVRN